MRKLVFLATLLVSINGFAATATSHQLNTMIMNGVQQHSDINRNNIKIYGGRDFSRSVIADANELVWSGQPTLVG